MSIKFKYSYVGEALWNTEFSDWYKITDIYQLPSRCFGWLRKPEFRVVLVCITEPVVGLPDTITTTSTEGWSYKPSRLEGQVEVLKGYVECLDDRLENLEKTI